MRKFLFVILCLFITSCNADDEVILPDNVVIFPANSHETSFEDWKGRWTPTKRDVVKAEKFVKEYLLSEEGKKQFSHPYFTETDETNKRIFSIFLERFPSDKRQYFGLIEKGKKVLFVNGVCSVKNEPRKQRR
ncbi:MAG: hypothetical protein D3925_09170 [Candidatus Electrothrix sp. AR5]|nr:hypothetical protein [Candidatus Electrothrix sp. AR5]